VEISQALHNVGSCITLGLGLLGLLGPRRAARLVHVAPEGLDGLSELRATYGGHFAALGVFTLAGQDPVAFALLGAAWIGTALGRLLSVLLDSSHATRNFGALLFEAVLGVLLLA